MTINIRSFWNELDDATQNTIIELVDKWIQIEEKQHTRKNIYIDVALSNSDFPYIDTQDIVETFNREMPAIYCEHCKKTIKTSDSVSFADILDHILRHHLEDLETAIPGFQEKYKNLLPVYHQKYKIDFTKTSLNETQNKKTASSQLLANSIHIAANKICTSCLYSLDKEIQTKIASVFGQIKDPDNWKNSIVILTPSKDNAILILASMIWYHAAGNVHNLDDGSFMIISSGYSA